MDPTEALANILRACAQDNTDEAQGAAESLADWLAAGGFCPNVREALQRACLDDLGQWQDGPHEGEDIRPVFPPTYWEGE